MTYPPQNDVSPGARNAPGLSRPAPLRTRLFESMEPVAAIWAQFQKDAVGSAYQKLEFAAAALAGPDADARPFIILGEDAAGRPRVLLPLVLRKRGLIRAAQYFGGKNSNLNRPLLAPGCELSPEDAAQLLREAYQAAREKPDVFVLANQTTNWSGHNPFARTGQASPSNAYGADIDEGGAAFLNRMDSKSTRKKLRLKRAKIAELGPISFERASAPEQARAVFHEMMTQKSARFTEQNKKSGLNALADSKFLEALALTPPDAPTLELYVLSVSDRLIAVYAGMPYRDHWSGMINSFNAEPEIARSSPAELLLRDMIGDLARRGFKSFDLGIGEARYKQSICDQTIDLVDVIVPMSPKGALWAGLERKRLHIKRRLKQSPTAMKWIERLNFYR